MPERQLPIFPAGATEINSSIAVQKEGEQIWYINDCLTVFHLSYEFGDTQSRGKSMEQYCTISDTGLLVRIGDIEYGLYFFCPKRRGKVVRKHIGRHVIGISMV
jgi:hypothetical protein